MSATLNEDFPLLEIVKQSVKPEHENHFSALAKINVNDKVEKKNNLSYLSWAWAVDQLLRADPDATWEYREPVRWNDTVMVFCTVTAFNKPMTAQLPVMDHRNKAIPNPDAFQVNTAMQRCLAKAIALHGLGLYIYAGEDLPLEEDENAEFAEQQAMAVRVLFNKGDIEGGARHLNTMGTGGSYDAEMKELAWGRLESNIRSSIKAFDSISQAKTLDALKTAWEAAPKHSHAMLGPVKDQRKAELSNHDQEAA
jgi:hypothetical protein